MATTAPEREAPTVLRVPPPETRWKRYSPHGEAPLSLAGSVAVHLLAGGGLLLLGMLLASAFFNPDRSLPIEPVRLLPGGSKAGGAGKGKGGGNAGVKDVGDPAEQAASADEQAERPVLNPVVKQAMEKKYAPQDIRLITDTRSGAPFAKLDDALRTSIRPSVEGGNGGNGNGGSGGKDGGKGGGDGPGPGEGKVKLNARERRMLRWHMRFNAGSGPAYVKQLADLGAILAFPSQGVPPPIFKAVDLTAGKAQLRDMDVSKFKRIYWIDDNPVSVRDVLATLGQRIDPLPSRLIAFMPAKLEKELYQQEKDYVIRVLRLRFIEDKIEETNFAVVLRNGRYVPVVKSVNVRP